MSPRIRALTVESLRSIGAVVKIEFPVEGPLLLLGENNAGKSNLTRAIDMVFGEPWPRTLTLDDHDFHGRDPEGIAVAIHAAVDGLPLFIVLQRLGRAHSVDLRPSEPAAKR